jgi:hypothetical protein
MFTSSYLASVGISQEHPPYNVKASLTNQGVRTNTPREGYLTHTGGVGAFVKVSVG